MKRAIVLALLLPLFACAVTPEFLVGSSLVDSTSSAATGKTVPDYAISAMTERDCVLLHGLSRGRICEEPIDGNKGFTSDMGPVPEPLDAPATSPTTAEEPRSKSSGRESAWTLVLAVVADYTQAVDMARRLQPKPGLVTAVEVAGEVAYRVTTQPFKFEEAAERQQDVAAQNFTSAVLAAVCPHWMQDGKCVVLDRVLPL